MRLRYLAALVTVGACGAIPMGWTAEPLRWEPAAASSLASIASGGIALSTLLTPRVLPLLYPALHSVALREQTVPWQCPPLLLIGVPFHEASTSNTAYSSTVSHAPVVGHRAGSRSE